MNGASKILTVSYGTFSCTLEGFEEPFNTMKAIAEYFRDLAADDRYFGAEPPIPDAAMLHRIAEREIQRRVEAKIQDNGVILRAEDPVQPRITMPAAHAAPAPVAAPALATVAEAAPAVESAAARLFRLRTAQSQIMPSAPAPLSDLAARFADVEAYAEDQDAEPAKLPITLIEPAAQPAAPAVEAVAVVPAEAIAAPADSQISVTVIETIIQIESMPPAAAPIEAKADAPAPDNVAAAVRETLAGLIDQDDQLAQDIAEANQIDAPDGSAVPDGAPEDFFEVEDTSAELADLRALDDADFLGDDDMIEAEVGADLNAAAPAMIEKVDLSDRKSQTNPALAAFPEAAEATIDAPDAAAESTAAEGAMAAVAQAPEMLATTAAPAMPPVAAEKLQRARARVIKIRRLDTMPAAPVAPLPEPAPLSAEAEAALQSELAALEAEIAPHQSFAVAEPVAEPEPVPQTTAEAVAEPPVKPEVEAEAEVSAESVAAAATEALTAPQAAAVAQTGSLAEPVATATAEPIAAAVAEDAEAGAAPPVTDSVLAESALAETHKLPDSLADDAERLLAQTNTALEVPETKRRRSAIAHLKAAVLATVAERRFNPNAGKQQAAVRMDPYRKDLDKVMRPAATAPSADRPAPLILVSTQRIDRKKDAVADAARPVPQIVPQAPQPAFSQPAFSQPAAPQPVRPRRVTTGSLAIQSDRQSEDDEDGELSPEDLDNIFADGKKQSFAEFADSLGATTMGELIEAAGAYCTLVLGRPSFTRPLLFQQIANMPHLVEMSREDTLRGFGRLLRDGRIQKTKRGQFALAEASPILTEAKRIAG